MKRICKDCGKEFELSSGEIQFYKSKNLTLPKRCKDCRNKKNENRNLDYAEERKHQPVQAKPESMPSPQERQVKGNGLIKKIAGIVAAILIVASIFVPKLSDYLGGFIQGVYSPQSSTQESQSYQFRNDDYLTEHFEKHGAEFSYKTKEEYLKGANRVIASKDSLHKLEKEDGDDVYFLESTGEFVIVSKDGYIRTYFKPEDGIDYFNRQ